MPKFPLSQRLYTLKLGSSQVMATTKGQDDIASSKKTSLACGEWSFLAFN